jgi:type IV fimbrial biogenesis protein FimT
MEETMPTNRTSIHLTPARGGRQTGFTVIELMVTVTILAIVMVIGAPAMRDMLARNRIVGQASDLTADLQLARAESNRRGFRVVVCKSSDLAGCSSSGTFADGWIVFVDANSNSAVDTGEEVLRVHQAAPTGITIAVSPNSGTPPNLTYYRPTGLVDSSGTMPRTFTVCQTGFTGRVVTVGNTGRTSVAPTSAVC